jgi:hypothetical protein
LSCTHSQRILLYILLLNYTISENASKKTAIAGFFLGFHNYCSRKGQSAYNNHSRAVRNPFLTANMCRERVRLSQKIDFAFQLGLIKKLCNGWRLLRFARKDLEECLCEESGRQGLALSGNSRMTKQFLSTFETVARIPDAVLNIICMKAIWYKFDKLPE